MILAELAKGLGYFGSVCGGLGALYVVSGHTDYKPIIKMEFDPAMSQIETNFKIAMEQVEQLTEGLARVDFYNLLAKRTQNNDKLDFEEQKKLCELGRYLKYENVPGCPPTPQ